MSHVAPSTATGRVPLTRNVIGVEGGDETRATTKWPGVGHFVTFAFAVGACGDNTVPIGPPLEHSATLFLGAHDDDDFIFMEPDLVASLAGSSSTTIYATTAGPHGPNLNLMDAAKVAYGSTVGSFEWECGSISIGTLVAEHCRLRDRPVSIVDLGLPDGGIPGDRKESLLHLIDGSIGKLDGYFGGSVDADSVTEVFAEIYKATTPDSVQTLELAGSHGRDHSSHMFVGSIGLWAAARVAYTGPITWNRGYNVDAEMPTLDGAALRDARKLLGYYEACADQCGPCGESCATLNASHESWIARQYQTTRVPEASGTLAQGDSCLDATLALGECTNAAHFDLSPTGTLRVADQCVTSAATDDLSLAPCTGAPEQFWVLDSEGAVWNGRLPQHAVNMTYDHTRCLAGSRAPICGATFEAHWMLGP